ncbi:hypothetical protein QAD02_002975 [Eretmocerus hayati]|uniref:Uncharacterized protein n=1 Tax=Eretmocerus hayati TaxID=131215 RepID=A0ACC2NLC9_9HYME|nr:hypothetical protein QAD02_002975 [Eretmocerus hayati]
MMEAEKVPGKHAKKNRARRDKKNQRNQQYLRAKVTADALEESRDTKAEVIVVTAERDGLLQYRDQTEELELRCNALGDQVRALQAENGIFSLESSNLIFEPNYATIMKSFLRVMY